MKSLTGTELMRGDAVIAPIAENQYIAGNVQELYDRTQDVRIGGHAIRIQAGLVLLASEAYEGFKPKGKKA
jgi:hypothetical protein